MLCPKSNTQLRAAMGLGLELPQRARTARLFGALTVGHGSPPKNAGVTGMEQLAFPTQSFDTLLLAVSPSVAHGPAAIVQFGRTSHVKSPPSAKVLT